jgi:hypothetical protein
MKAMEDQNKVPVAVLFVRSDSFYKSMQSVDCWDIGRDARQWPGGSPLVAHPPCRAWGKLRNMAKPRDDEKALAIFAVEQVRKWGGVVEHPAASTLWRACSLPEPGFTDEFGGWTLPILQSSWGHRADKATRLYIVGARPLFIPSMPYVMGRAQCIVGTSGRRKDGSRPHKGGQGYRPEVTKKEREETPPALCDWLVELARRCRRND